jgi:hypothetical protein
MSAITVSQKFIDDLRYENRQGSVLLVDRAGNKWLAGDGCVFPLGPHPVVTGDYVYTEHSLVGQLDNALVIHVPTITVVLTIPRDVKNGIFVVNKNSYYINGSNFHIRLIGPTAGERLAGRITCNGSAAYLTRDEFATRLYKDTLIHEWKGAEKHAPYFIGANAVVFNGEIHEFE